MALTFDLNPPGGGIVISGTADELTGLAEGIAEAVEGLGEEAGSLLTEEGVEDVIVRVLEEQA